MAQELSPLDRDALIRTIIGEAADQPLAGQAAVAHVVLNRLNSGKYGNSVSDVVFQPGAFEPWGTRSKELRSISTKSKSYNDVGKIVDAVALGGIPDATGGATYFLQPDLMEKRGKPLPKWAQGPGVQIGDHRFFAEGSTATPSKDGGTIDYLAIGAKRQPQSQATGSVAPSDVPDFLAIGARRNASPDTAAPGDLPMIGIRQVKPDELQPPTRPQAPAAPVSEFTERVLKPLQRAPETAADLGSGYASRAGELLGQSAGMVGQGMANISANRPAQGVGEVGLGLLGIPGSFIQALDDPLAKITGNAEFAERFPMVVPGASVARAAMTARPSVRALNEIIADIGGPQNIPYVIGRLRENPRLTLMDVSDNVRANAAGMAVDTRNVGAINRLTGLQRARAATAGDDASSAFSDVLGPTPNAKAMVDELKAKAQETGKQVIDPALDNSSLVNVSQVVRNIDKQFPAETLDALKRGETPASMPDVEKRLWSIRQKVYGGKRDKDVMLMTPQEAHDLQSSLRVKYAGDKELGYEARQVRRDLIGAIDEASGGKYRDALKQYADDMSVDAAFKKGFDIFTEPTTSKKILANHPDMWRAWTKEASAPELDAIKKGIMLAADTRIRRMRGGDVVPQGSNIHARLAAVLGKKDADRIVNALEESADIARSHAAIDEARSAALNVAGQGKREIRGKASESPLIGAALAEMAGLAGTHFSPIGMHPGVGTALYMGSRYAKKGMNAIGRRRDIAENDSYARWATSLGPDRDTLISLLQSAAQPVSNTKKLLNLVVHPDFRRGAAQLAPR